MDGVLGAFNGRLGWLAGWLAGEISRYQRVVFVFLLYPSNTGEADDKLGVGSSILRFFFLALLCFYGLGGID